MDTGHYYTPQGDPAHEGGLVTARKLGYFPSVTTILRIMNKEGINQYRVRQMMEAALTLPRWDGENDREFITRLEEDARAHSAAASERGKLVHRAIQGYWETGILSVADVPAEIRPVVQQVGSEISSRTMGGWAEVSFANLHLGYGGQIDFVGTMNGKPVIWDYKTQDVKGALKNGLPQFVTYPEWAMQLAAYRYAVAEIPGFHPYRTADCYSLMISTNPRYPGIKLKQWPERHDTHMDLTRAFRQFNAARSLYYLTANLAPPPRTAVTQVRIEDTLRSA